MKTITMLLLLIPAAVYSQSASIVGKWQMVRQSNCVEDELSADDAETQELIEDMKGMSGQTPQVLEFKDNNGVHESTKIISKRKSYNSKSMLYRLSENGLFFLDKKSRTIIESFTVEKLTLDSLIISNSTRVCETKIFVRIK
jgi:hypothetical protein